MTMLAQMVQRSFDAKAKLKGSTMAKRDSTQVRWRVQVRSNRSKPWRNKSGLYETRQSAREERDLQREYFGFGNTRVIPHVKGQQ